MQAVDTKRCVLVVDDHAESLRMLSRLLRLNGYEVYEATSFQEALAVIGGARCKVVLTDISLPDGSGLDLLPAMRAQGLNVRGLAISGHANREQARAARDAGFDDHVPKPFRFADLLQHVQRLMN